MNLTRRASILALAALNATLVAAQDGSTGFDDATVGQLKQVYLSCERAAMKGELGSAGIMHCSIVYEQLKRQAFGGDFEKLVAWSRMHMSADTDGAANTAQTVAAP